MIEFRATRKEYDDVVAVADLDLTIPQGEIFGLIGPNGAGKTTTIRMACGLLTPTSGTVRVNGLDVHQQPEAAQQFIGYLSDFFSLYDDLKVWEYLDYFAHAYKMSPAEIPARIDEVIAAVSLEVKRDALIGGLSRGMKQRLGIARAIIHRPSLLLLDEPASGLDPKARLELRNLLRGIRDQGATVLISSHILPDLEGFCTSIGVMERGRMVRSGTLEEITRTTHEDRFFRIQWTNEAETVVRQVIESDALVSPVSVGSHEAVIRHSGTDDEVTVVLQRLVAAGVRVLYFGEVKHTVEELYMKISHHEVM